VAGPSDIQRFPRGLLNVIGNFGGVTPISLSDQVAGVLELVQCYGLSQLTSLRVNDAALAEGVPLFNLLSNTSWTVLFGASLIATKTATQTALRGSLSLSRIGLSGDAIVVAAEELGPFGATETGVGCVSWFPPYPILCPPGSNVFGRLDVLGTDAVAYFQQHARTVEFLIASGYPITKADYTPPRAFHPEVVDCKPTGRIILD